MKNTLKVLSAFILLVLLLSFNRIVTSDGVMYHELKQNEIITFDGKQSSDTNTYSGSIQRGSGDSTGYHIVIDKEGNLDVKNLKAADGKNQNDLTIYHCSGTITRNNDTLKVQAKSSYKTIYIINIEKKVIVDSFYPDIKIGLVSKTLKNKYCPSLVTTKIGNIKTMDIVALPKKINTDELFKPKHEDKTIGIFSYLAVADIKGKFKFFPAGDYVFIGGNTINISH